MQETQIWSLGLEDPLKKEMASLSSILAWEIPWTEEPGGIVHRVAELDTTEWLSTHTIKRNKLDICNINELQKHYPKSKKPGTKDYDRMILLIWKLLIDRPSYSDGNKIHDCQGSEYMVGGGDWLWRGCRNSLRCWKCFIFWLQ